MDLEPALEHHPMLFADAAAEALLAEDPELALNHPTAPVAVDWEVPTLAADPVEAAHLHREASVVARMAPKRSAR